MLARARVTSTVLDADAVRSRREPSLVLQPAGQSNVRPDSEVPLTVRIHFNEWVLGEQERMTSQAKESIVDGG